MAPLMYSHWNNTFFKDCNIVDDYVIEKEKWVEIGKKLKLSRMEMPSSIGRPPRDIYKYNAGFKAVYHIKGWNNFVKSVKICTKHVITKDDLEDLKVSLKNFYKYYEKEYYRNDPTRLSACRMCLHYLLHVAGCIEYLVFIQLTSRLIEDTNLEIKYFTKFTTYEFIDVRLIDHCIGLFKLGSKYYIIDKENNVEEEWDDI
nr:12641_t:CDS:2 [Entrophospora candida]